MALSLHQIDQLLVQWRQNLDLISQNLLDLHGSSTYQRLTTTTSALIGVTQAQVVPVLEVMTELFQQFGLLLEIVDRATNLRQQISRWLISAPQLLEIENLIVGPSIQLMGAQVPLLQRGLLTAVEQPSTMTPQQVLTAMTIAFEQAKAVILAVDAAWSQLAAQLAQSDRQLNVLAALALNQADVAKLAKIRVIIATISAQIETDPLGAQAGLTQQIDPAIAQLKSTFAQRQRQQAEVQAQLQEAKGLFAQLQQLQQQTIATDAESQAKISGVERQSAIAPAHLEALSSWLTRLATTYAQGNFQAVAVGLANWMGQTKSYIALEETAIKTNGQPLKTRQELRGRLDALQAKARARGLIEDPTLTKLAAQAKQILYTRPTPLNVAITLVADYEKYMNCR